MIGMDFTPSRPKNPSHAKIYPKNRSPSAEKPPRGHPKAVRAVFPRRARFKHSRHPRVRLFNCVVIHYIGQHIAVPLLDLISGEIPAVYLKL